MGGNWLFIDEEAIKTPVPLTVQELSFSCGAAALRSILYYFNINTTEEEVREIAETTKKGTHTTKIIKAARFFGLKTKARYNMQEQDLKDSLNKKRPIIVCFQAWGDIKYYKTKDSGHYAVVIGYDEENIYFQDPSIREKSRGYLSWQEFIHRWHDKDSENNKRDRYGIAIWKPGVKKNKEEIHRSKKIE